MGDISTNYDEILGLCKNINTNYTSAVDYLSSRILKDAFLVLVDKLVICFNLSFSIGNCPDAWKLAKITTRHKGGQKNQINNYRPISLLPLPGKLKEKIFHNRISSYLEENKLLNPEQNGFRPNHSTKDTVAKFTDDIATNINDNNCTIATFIDFRKAFDTVNHQILLDRINGLGMRNEILLWLTSYLNNRKQVVVANGATSSQGPGVPQGSTLGPISYLYQ